MKSRDVMLASLIAGLVVLWLSISPAPVGASALLGGCWVPATPGFCCSGTVDEECSGYSGCSSSNSTHITACVADPNGNGTGQIDEGQPCTSGTQACTETYNCQCV